MKIVNLTFGARGAPGRVTMGHRDKGGNGTYFRKYLPGTHFTGYRWMCELHGSYQSFSKVSKNGSNLNLDLEKYVKGVYYVGHKEGVEYIRTV